MQKDYKSPTEDSANENQEIKNIQDVNTDDTKAKDIITTKSFDDYPYGGESKGGNNKESSADQVFATTDGEGATQEDWFKYANPNEQNGNQAAPNQGPVNMGEATRNENNQVQNPSANNTATNPPSASSGVPQATPPVSIPAASAPPLPTTNLGKTPLDSAAIKNAAPEELNARLSENLKEQKNVMALYQNALFPNIGESPQDFEARKDGLENQLTKLDKESREIKKEKKSRGI
jgi:hypothetical protein